MVISMEEIGLMNVKPRDTLHNFRKKANIHKDPLRTEDCS